MGIDHEFVALRNRLKVANETFRAKFLNQQ